MPKSKLPVRLCFTQGEAEDLLGLIKWAKGQGFHAFTEHAKKNGHGHDLRMAAAKMAIALCQPDWEVR
jgi:hypothetical protein